MLSQGGAMCCLRGGGGGGALCFLEVCNTNKSLIVDFFQNLINENITFKLSLVLRDIM